jgi:hypothetical protein
MTAVDFTPEALARLAAGGYTPERLAAISQGHLIAEALFASDIQPSEPHTCDDLCDTACRTLNQLGETGCADVMATEYGAHPDQAAARMRWALDAEQRLANDHALAGGAG